MSKPNRLETRFAEMKQAGKKAFITYMTAGYPDAETFQTLLKGQANAGADILEVGVPFSDPLADGPIIQVANVRALQKGMTVPKVLALISDFRKQDDKTPIVLMGSYNPIFSYGVLKFVEDAAKAGVDGLIVSDLPPEEDAELREPAKEQGVIFIRFVTPTTDDKRLPVVLKEAAGFLYYISVTGITGDKSAESAVLSKSVANLRKHTALPVAIGFGINTPQQAREMAAAADAVIVGSAIVKRVTSHLGPDGTGEPDAQTVPDVLSLVASLAAAVHQV